MKEILTRLFYSGIQYQHNEFYDNLIAPGSPHMTKWVLSSLYGVIHK